MLNSTLSGNEASRSEMCCSIQELECAHRGIKQPAPNPVKGLERSDALVAVQLRFRVQLRERIVQSLADGSGAKDDRHPSRRVEQRMSQKVELKRIWRRTGDLLILG